MNRLQRVLKVFGVGADNGQLDTAFGAIRNSRYTSFLSTAPEHEVLRMLEACEVDGESPKAREWVKLSRLLFSHLSIYENALAIHANLVGGVIVSEKSEISPRTREQVEKFIQECPVLSEMQPEQSDCRGLNVLVAQMVIDVLRDGMAFVQDRFEPETEMPLGVMQFDADHFDYAPIQSGEFDLVYLMNQFPRRDEKMKRIENPFFDVLKIEADRNDPWGVPLIRGGKLLTRIFITILVGIEMQTKRFSNPPSFNLISQTDPQFNGTGTGPELFLDAVKRLRELVDAALRLMMKGKPAEVVMSLPGNVKMESKVFGEGFNAFIDDDMLWKIGVLFASVTSVPPALLGIKITGSGLGSEEFSYLWKILLARVRRIREAIRPVILRRIQNHLVSLKVSPAEIAALQIEFSDLDMLSEKERAEIRKIEAETEEKRFAIYQEMRAVDPDEARLYAEQNNLYQFE